MYSCGPPGRGKTWLVDAYVRAVGGCGGGVARWLLHEFFQDLHAAIGESGARGGLAGAVTRVLAREGAGASMVVLDEFTVHDPADGVFLDRVLRELDRRRVRVVVTSNRLPTELMPNPLFHGGFEPTIDLIERLFAVEMLDDGRDLRVGGSRSRIVPVRSGFVAGRWTVACAELLDLAYRDARRSGGVRRCVGPLGNAARCGARP
ncbi:AFG1/ZapE family ATPase [Gordonia sp. (in: high G+C Gram-positive bacteria)]|uniref:AFG1/ZapE family ATPase n=1 Tax=Gordonia sp. (in: high G+C Gram-positive bacteria) TaxID=84139 RepID=UPI00345AC65A